MLNMDVEKPHIQRTDLKVTWGEPPRASGAALKPPKKKKCYVRSSLRGSVETNQTSIREGAGSIPGLSRWVKDPVLL